MSWGTPPPRLHDGREWDHPKTLSPIIERIRVVIKNIRQKVAGSWKNTMPTMTVPTAPIPVHTGYTVPIGNRSAAFAIKNILNDSAVMNPFHHHTSSCPVAVLVFPRQNVKPTSMSPAKIRIIQFITDCILVILFEGCKQSARQSYGEILGVSFQRLCKVSNKFHHQEMIPASLE